MMKGDGATMGDADGVMELRARRAAMMITKYSYGVDIEEGR